MSEKIHIHWFRRDLRLEDNASLYHALKSSNKTTCLFIFDKNILDKLIDKDDRRVTFIHLQIQKLKKQLQLLGADLIVKYGTPVEIWKSLLTEYNIGQVYTNHDYEPYGITRDKQIQELLHLNNIPFNTFKDSVIFEKMEIGKDDGTPYTVFTPYSKKWKNKLNDFYLKEYPVDKYIQNLSKIKLQELPSIEDMGFVYNDTFLPSIEIPINPLTFSNLEFTRCISEE